MALKPETFLDGIVYGEGPRWHDGRLWFSDIHAHKVEAVDMKGKAEVMARMDYPSGIGWLPDGTPLVTSMRSCQLMRLGPGGATSVADLKPLGSIGINDMVVDGKGRAYIDSRMQSASGGTGLSGAIVMATPDGKARVVADGMDLPNGMVVTPDGKRLIVGVTFAHNLLSFDIQPDGSLANRRLFAQLDKDTPDGICLDAEGGIWLGSPDNGDAVRVLEGGKVTHRISFKGRICIACALGGPDRRTLFMVNFRGTLQDIIKGFGGDAETLKRFSGLIETVRVDAPGAGWP